MSTIRLTMAQALVRYLIAQRTVLDGKEAPLFAGVFAIFGHGNVTCLGEALEVVQQTLPTWRGQNEQSMALAAIAFAKARRGRRGPCQPSARAAAGGRHFRQSAARSRAVAGRALPQSRHHGERRLPGG